MWSFQYGLKGNIQGPIHQKDNEIEDFVRTQGLRYYNSALHNASFALPNFVKELIKK
jgi:spermidine synthase